VSCSSSSTMPTEPSSRRGSVRPRASGDAVRGMLDRSLLLPLAILVGPGGLRPLNVPRARVTVLMPPSSLVLLSILAAASELEKRAGSCGRRSSRREEKNSGEGGCPLLWKWAYLVMAKWSSEYRARVCTRRRLCRGSLVGSWGRAGVWLWPWSSGLFFPASAGGV
jgi:hypothetical protein